MTLNKETLKQTVKKGYTKGKTFIIKTGDKIFEDSNDIKWFAAICIVDIAMACYCSGRSKGYNKGYEVGREDQLRIEDEWFDGMDLETYNTVREYDKRRHRPILQSNQK